MYNIKYAVIYKNVITLQNSWSHLWPTKNTFWRYCKLYGY